MNSKKIALVGILTALYVVLGAFVKIPFIGNITLDLGYAALAVACATVGPWAGFVGAFGCGIESILFSQYGFSVGWFCANLVVGIGCGYVFTKTTKLIYRVLAIVVFVAIGMIGIKTGIECWLYHIPFAVKVVKSLVAFLADSLVMIIGTTICIRLPKEQ